jgi:hypothetical protein
LLSDATAAANEVENEHHKSDHEQYVDEAARHVKGEPSDPKEEK